MTSHSGELGFYITLTVLFFFIMGFAIGFVTGHNNAYDNIDKSLCKATEFWAKCNGTNKGFAHVPEMELGKSYRIRFTIQEINNTGVKVV